ncbi:hypothetical protein [Azospirillum sp. ST 5-10]|uniref:hypothetical protein n=1 Tax=unclassified Azospirillum TaxID=2630922 RepID=UPI003F4A6E62
MRCTLPIAVTVLLLHAAAAGLPAHAQPAPPSQGPDWPAGVRSWHSGEDAPKGGDPDEAERRGLTSPEVKDSQMPEPTQQGTRPPEPSDTEQAKVELYGALNEVRRAPPGLDGRPTPRPNPFASEPALEMEPSAAGNPDVLFPENYVE